MSAGGRGFVTCPSCRIPNPVGPAQCWNCGTALPVPAGGPTPASAPGPTPVGAAAAAPAWSSDSSSPPAASYAYSPPIATSPSYGANAEEYRPRGSDRWLTVGVIASAAVLVAVVVVFAMAG